MEFVFFAEVDKKARSRFKAGSIQSQMRKEAPVDLLLTYTRIMTSLLRFNPSPRSIAMIRLGGRSVAKWCHRHFAACGHHHR